MSDSQIRLTQTVQKGGCAAKVAALELRKILASVRFPPVSPNVLIDGGTFDDAAIYRLSPDQALVQTLDFFTPIVDSPDLFGRIAAANALSDVYAMGGRPITAMAIFAFPLATLPSEVAVQVLQGASDVIAESGASFVGGHTIDDDTLKFGLSVTGLMNPQKVWSNAGAQPGDALILTKALGTGTLTAALKRGETDEDGIRDALDSMGQLNDISSLLSEAEIGSIHAATDITGFGLAGHALNMARASGVSFNIETTELPRFERTMEFLGKGLLTKAHRTNREYVEEKAVFGDENPLSRQLVFDPQTSGGLLFAVSERIAGEFLSRLKGRFPFARRIGFVAPQDAVTLRFS
jgi:selenide,water dikinase